MHVNVWTVWGVMVLVDRQPLRDVEYQLINEKGGLSTQGVGRHINMGKLEVMLEGVFSCSGKHYFT